MGIFFIKYTLDEILIDHPACNGDEQSDNATSLTGQEHITRHGQSKIWTAFFLFALVQTKCCSMIEPIHPTVRQIFMCHYGWCKIVISLTSKNFVILHLRWRCLVLSFSLFTGSTVVCVAVRLYNFFGIIIFVAFKAFHGIHC